MRKVADIPNRKWALIKRVGYWWTEEGSDLPHPKNFVDLSWDEDEKRRVLDYISHCYQPPYAFAGYSWCRMGCEGVPSDIGTQDLTDGTYVFPEGLVHYIKSHNLKPEQDFISHIKANNFTVPELTELKT